MDYIHEGETRTPLFFEGVFTFIGVNAENENNIPSLTATLELVGT